MPDFLNLKQESLKCLDALTYLAIRSFHSNEKEYCYPPYEKIMERSGLGRTFLSQSIKRLKDAGFLTIKHSKREGTCNRYYFGKLEHYENISYDVLFKTKDLTKNEKAMLICLRQFFVRGKLQCRYSTKVIAELLGISYSQVYKPLRGLITKGYIKEVYIQHKLSSKTSIYLKLTNNINWPLPKCTIHEMNTSALILKIA